MTYFKIIKLDFGIFWRCFLRRVSWEGVKGDVEGVEVMGSKEGGVSSSVSEGSSLGKGENVE